MLQDLFALADVASELWLPPALLVLRNLESNEVAARPGQGHLLPWRPIERPTLALGSLPESMGLVEAVVIHGPPAIPQPALALAETCAAVIVAGAVPG